MVHSKRKNRRKRIERIITIVFLLVISSLVALGLNSYFAGCPDGLPQISSEAGLALHIHVHLDVFVNASPVGIPGSVGHLYSGNFCAIHTQDTSGIIHVESPIIQSYTIQQIIDVWGYPIPHSAIVYVNGRINNNSYDLSNHDEIAIVIGTPPNPIPSVYDWSLTGL